MNTKREIKFRYYWQHDITCEVISNEFTLSELEDWQFSKSSYTMEWECLGRVQFTGLLDKNGKEIYEGDILRLRYRLNPGSIMLTVKIEFKGASFWFTGDGRTDCLWHFHNEDDREVIGNIYQNADLLKSPDEGATSATKS